MATVAKFFVDATDIVEITSGILALSWVFAAVYGTY